VPQATALTALEAAFLYAESEITPMHIGSLAIFDGAGWCDSRGRFRLQSLRDYVAGRLEQVPRLRQRPVWPAAGLGRPHWTFDTAFDIDRHVRRLRLPHPVSEEQLLSAMADLNMNLLERSHPLWELWFVDGLEGGRVAMIEKIHHALVDGIGGVDLAIMLLDSTPSRSLREARTARPVAGRAPSRLALMGKAMEAATVCPVAFGRDLASLAVHPARTMDRARGLTSAIWSLASERLAPQSSLNEAVGRSRQYRLVRSSLEDVRSTGHALGGTVNDVVLTAVAAGLAGLLAGRQDDFSGPLHALVPVSVRAATEHPSLGNQVAAFLVLLPTEASAVQEQFAAVRKATQFAKSHHQSDLALALLKFADFWPEPLVAAVSQLLHRQPFANLVVTNVPGPPTPLYLMESQMLEVFPLVPLLRNLTVSVAVLSYGSQLTMGVWADGDGCPDVDELVSGIEGALRTLQAQARSLQSDSGATMRFSHR
jgi:diacylglycerol O-acyltransferase / wax synthase